MTTRGYLTQKQKEALLKKQGDCCAACGEKLISGLFEFDHRQDLQFEGDNALDNWQALCTAPPYRCHQAKTAAAKKAKSHAIRVRIGKPHKAIKSQPFPGSRASKWKKPFNSPAVRR